MNLHGAIFVKNKRELIYPLKEGISTTYYYATDSQLFHVIHEVYLAIGHVGI